MQFTAMGVLKAHSGSGLYTRITLVGRGGHSGFGITGHITYTRWNFLTCPTLVGQFFKLGSRVRVGQVQPPTSILLVTWTQVGQLPKLGWLWRGVGQPGKGRTSHGVPLHVEVDILLWLLGWVSPESVKSGVTACWRGINPLKIWASA